MKLLVNTDVRDNLKSAASSSYAMFKSEREAPNIITFEVLLPVGWKDSDVRKFDGYMCTGVSTYGGSSIASYAKIPE